MSWGSFDFAQFRQCAQGLERALEQQRVQKMLAEALQQIANEILAAVVRRTPVDTGQLRRNWQITGVQRQGNDFLVTIYNNVEYAIFVEHGHRIVVNGATVGFVDGKYMLCIGVEQVAKRMPQILEKHTQALLQEIFGGN